MYGSNTTNTTNTTNTSNDTINTTTTNNNNHDDDMCVYVCMYNTCTRRGGQCAARACAPWPP